jgi:BarA-like signal transduction histidine kinase
MAVLLKSTLSALVTAFLLLALLPGHVSAQAEQSIQFGGTYAHLKPAQRALVDE